MRIIFITLLFIPCIAFAANWVEYNPGFWIDTNSISQKRNFKKAWFKSKDAKLKDGNAYTGFKQYNETKSLEYFDCKTRESATLEIYYYSDLDFLGSFSARVNPSLFTEVAPDTIGEIDLELACNKQALKKLLGN